MKFDCLILTDSRLTLSKVSKALEALDMYTLNDFLGVSDAHLPGVRKRIWRESETQEQYREKLILWWLSLSPFASWEFLAEANAVVTGVSEAFSEAVKKNCKHKPGKQQN